MDVKTDAKMEAETDPKTKRLKEEVLEDLEKVHRLLLQAASGDWESRLERKRIEQKLEARLAEWRRAVG